MTSKPDEKDGAKAAKPKRKKETVKDLTADRKAEDVRGGRIDFKV